MLMQMNGLTSCMTSLNTCTSIMEKTFYLEDINKAIKKLIPLGCKIDPSNVILKAGKTLQFFQEVYDSCDQYLADFYIAEYQNLNIVCDEPIFRKLNNYK